MTVSSQLTVEGVIDRSLLQQALLDSVNQQLKEAGWAEVTMDQISITKAGVTVPGGGNWSHCTLDVLEDENDIEYKVNVHRTIL